LLPPVELLLLSTPDDDADRDGYRATSIAKSPIVCNARVLKYCVYCDVDRRLIMSVYARFNLVRIRAALQSTSSCMHFLLTSPRKMRTRYCFYSLSNYQRLKLILCAHTCSVPGTKCLLLLRQYNPSAWCACTAVDGFLLFCMPGRPRWLSTSTSKYFFLLSGPRVGMAEICIFHSGHVCAYILGPWCNC
jgi:hypothetical protein